MTHAGMKLADRLRATKRTDHDAREVMREAAAALDAAEKALEAASLVCGSGQTPTFRQKHEARDLIPAALTLIRGDTP